MQMSVAQLTESKQADEGEDGEPDHESSDPSHDDDPNQGKDHGQDQASVNSIKVKNNEFKENRSKL